MSTTGRCLIQIDGGDGLFFISTYGGYTENIQEARIFNNELDAQIYVRIMYPIGWTNLKVHSLKSDRQKYPYPLKWTDGISSPQSVDIGIFHAPASGQSACDNSPSVVSLI